MISFWCIVELIYIKEAIILRYTDADYATDLDKRMSTRGYVFKL